MTTVTETLASVDAPPTKRHPSGFMAGLVLWDDVVVEAADIIKYMKRWPRERVRTYCQERSWTVRVVHQIERTDIVNSKK